MKIMNLLLFNDQLKCSVRFENKISVLVTKEEKK